MTVVAVLVTSLLALGAGLALIRVVRGPSVLDRIVATDVLLAVIVMAIAAEAAFSRDATGLPILVVLSILGFTGAVSVARFTSAGASSPGDAAQASPGGTQPHRRRLLGEAAARGADEAATRGPR
ncbi:monovalent cation/H+ antiporter complex subunit F [Actinoplanes sp. NPDC049596]|uniref:monovalent cation/H+ antiporter complex subunit F n=1 Tax=unclassified Actinoplanes TaxID=2626549 RepID=UPI00341F2B37